LETNVSNYPECSVFRLVGDKCKYLSRMFDNTGY